MFCNWLRPMRRRVPPRAHKSSWRFRPDLEALEDRLAPAVALLVTSPGDAVAPDGVVTLREALLAANNNSTVNEAVHDGSGGIDTIRFDTAGAFATPQTIVLGGAELAVTDSVTITGPGAARLSISGAGVSRIFHVDDGVLDSTIAVGISGLTLTGGTADDGGACPTLPTPTPAPSRWSAAA